MLNDLGAFFSSRTNLLDMIQQENRHPISVLLVYFILLKILFHSTFVQVCFNAAII